MAEESRVAQTQIPYSIPYLRKRPRIRVGAHQGLRGLGSNSSKSYF